MGIASSSRRQSRLDPQRASGNVVKTDAASSRRRSGTDRQRLAWQRTLIFAVLCRRQIERKRRGRTGRRATKERLNHAVAHTKAASPRRQIGRNRQRWTGHRATKERLDHAVAYTAAASPCRHLESHRRRRKSANTRAIDDESHHGVGVADISVKSWCESREEILYRPDRLRPHGKIWIPTPLHVSDDDLTSGDNFDPF